MLKIIQIGMNTSDTVSSLRLYSEAFGFSNAGCQAVWGEPMRLQGLNPDSRALIWWMVGPQKFFQLEFFHHVEPVQRPLRADWRPCDHGWVRIGIAVHDLDRCVEALARNSVKVLGQSATSAGRRIAFRDPFVGAIVEVIENTEQKMEEAEGSKVVYATSSVSDIETARSFYQDTIGFTIEPIELLHQESDEAMWGLGNAERKGFLARSNDICLEIVQYFGPTVGRPRPSDYKVSDQGITNVALGSRVADDIRDVLGRLDVAGLTPPLVMEKYGFLAAYICEPDREFELVALPAEMDRFFGFEVQQPFLGIAP